MHKRVALNQQDFYSGLLFMSVGMAFAWGAGRYDIGTAGEMGSGYFPRLLGIVTAVLGATVSLKALRTGTEEGGRIGPWAWKQLLLIIAANLVFGVMIGGLPSLNLPPMGLALGVFLLVFVASLAGDEFRLKEVLLLGAILTVAVYLICVKVLNLYVPLFPPFVSCL